MKKAVSFLLIFLPLFVFTQEVITFKVIAGEHNRFDCPVFVDLSDNNIQIDIKNLTLFEIAGSGAIPVDFQVDNRKKGIWFIVNGNFPKDSERHFELKAGKDVGTKSSNIMNINQTEDALVLRNGTTKILKYQEKTLMPPAGVDSAFQRSGFIHPLWSPAGEVLTRIQPPDHYHHYGIWGPWTKTQVNGREVDFWNLKKKQGTVRFAGLTDITEGPVFCEIKVQQEHIDFGLKTKNRVAISEMLTVRAWNVGKDAWMIDYITAQSTPLDSGILLEAYRYGGGIGFRATEKWTKDNCFVLTSEGKERDSADGTKARWCRVTGIKENGKNGILFMDYMQNREFPEPMRVWPSNSIDDKGYFFFEFCPIRHNSWKMEYGEKYELRYRLFVFDGNLSKEDAEALWQAFAHPPKVVFEE